MINMIMVFPVWNTRSLFFVFLIESSVLGGRTSLTTWLAVSLGRFRRVRNPRMHSRDRCRLTRSPREASRPCAESCTRIFSLFSSWAGRSEAETGPCGSGTFPARSPPCSLPRMATISQRIPGLWLFRSRFGNLRWE